MNLSRETDVSLLRAAAKSLQLENARLRAEAAAASRALAVSDERSRQREAAVHAQQEAIDHHEAALQRHEAKAKELQDEVTRLEQALRTVQEQLDMRIKELYGRSTERRPLDDPPAGDAPAKEKPARKSRKGHGRTAQPRLPKDEVRHNLVGKELVCTGCGGQLLPIDTLVEKAELIAMEKRRIVLETHLRTVYKCDCCACLKTAPGALKLVAGGRYALSFSVSVAYQKYFAHLPLERQRQMMKHEGLQVTTATLYDQANEMATTLKNTYDTLCKLILKEKVLRADETPWAVMSNGYNDNEKFYAWVVVGGSYVVFRLLNTRSKDGAAEVLGSFGGTLMVDGLTSYPAAAKGKPGEPLQFIVANCNAHSRRKFVECEKYWPAESDRAVGLYRKLYDLEREGKKPGADLGALRQTKSKPLMDELFAWAKQQQTRTDIPSGSGLAGALAYLVNHEAGLRVFLDDPAVPIDNNESERAVRPLVLGRVNFGGSRSRRGAEVAAILYTLVESAKRCGVSPEDYLYAAAEHALSAAGAVLLPDEFKRQLEAVHDPPVLAD